MQREKNCYLTPKNTQSFKSHFFCLSFWDVSILKKIPKFIRKNWEKKRNKSFQFFNVWIVRKKYKIFFDKISFEKIYFQIWSFCPVCFWWKVKHWSLSKIFFQHFSRKIKILKRTFKQNKNINTLQIRIRKDWQFSFSSLNSSVSSFTPVYWYISKRHYTRKVQLKMMKKLKPSSYVEELEPRNIRGGALLKFLGRTELKWYFPISGGLAGKF